MAVLSLRLLPTYCQFFLGVLVPEGVRDGLVIGTFLLKALICSYFLPPYSLLEPRGPQKPCLTPLSGSRRRGAEDSCCPASSLAGRAGRTSHQPLFIPPLASLWRGAPSLIRRAGEQGSYQVFGSCAFLVSGGLHWLPPLIMSQEGGEPLTQHERPQLEMQRLTFLRGRAEPPPCVMSRGWNSLLIWFFYCDPELVSTNPGKYPYPLEATLP